MLLAQDFLKYWDILVFVESTIYDMDEQNEALARDGVNSTAWTFQG